MDDPAIVAMMRDYTPPAKSGAASADPSAKLLQDIVYLSTNPDYVDPETGQRSYNKQLGELVAAYNAINKKDQFAPISVGNGNVLTFEPKTGQPKWIHAPENTTPPQTVQPGEGVLNPQTGKYEVPVPTAKSGAPVVDTTAQWIPGPNYAQDGQWIQNGNYVAPNAAKSAEDIHNESSASIAASNAATARANAETNAIETPAQRQAREIAVADKQAHDQIDNALQLAQQNAGDEKALANLKAELDRVNASHVGEIQRINDAYKHELDQPQLDKTNAIAERGAATGEKNAATSATQVENQRIQNEQANAATERQRQTTVLQDQAKGASDFVNQGIKLGVAPTMGLIRGMIDPLQIALHLSQQTVQSGAIPPTAMPVPQAPTPAGPQPAPMPAPQPTAPPPAPAPAPAPFAQSDIPEGTNRRGY